MKPFPPSPVAESLSLDRRDVLRLAAMFGLTLTVPDLASPATATRLTAEELALIGSVSEVIIPATDTGGALAAGVPDFVKMMLSEWFSATERAHFMAGLREFSAGARRRYGRDFDALTAAEKDDYVGARLAAAAAAPPARAPFVVLMKRLTIFGYYTSELGATSELHQQIATAQYVPAADVKPGDRADSGITSASYPLSAG